MLHFELNILLTCNHRDDVYMGHWKQLFHLLHRQFLSRNSAPISTGSGKALEILTCLTMVLLQFFIFTPLCSTKVTIGAQNINSHY